LGLPPTSHLSPLTPYLLPSLTRLDLAVVLVYCAASLGGGLRVSVLPGGCSGFKYSLNIEERPLDDDLVADVTGVRVFVDGFSAQYLNGITIDYVTSMQGSGFTFHNPNATGGCGCGTSFTA